MGKGKKLLGTILTVTLIFSFVCIAFGASQFMKDGNERKGKYMYRKNCRSCHDGSGAVELSPNSKTQAQWERTFDRYERLECVEEWNKLQEQVRSKPRYDEAIRFFMRRDYSWHQYITRLSALKFM